MTKGLINPHPAQQSLAALLDGLSERLDYDGSPRVRDQPQRSDDVGTGNGGVYIYGPVGGGKTMLLDMFFDGLALVGKRRMHIHELIAEFHQQVDAMGKPGQGALSGSPNPGLWEGLRLLCIDEVAVSDIGDATILSRILTDLRSRGIILVLTANVPPDSLYEGGLNRVLFTPLIQLLTQELQLVRLDPGADLRAKRLADQAVWFVLDDLPAKEAMDDAFARATDGAVAEMRTVQVRGHVLRIPRQAHGVARFTYKELCLAALWTADYYKIASLFHTVMIEGIPARFAHRNHARRFCALIDILHEAKVKLVASAHCEPEDLYFGMAAAFQPAIGPPTATSPTSPEMLEFRRTVSRLHEMRSSYYANLK